MRWLNNDSKFGQLCTLLGTVIAANLMFVLTLIPVVTAGAGLCGLYYTMLKLLRYKEVNPFAEFFHGFKDNFKKATAAWLGFLLIALFLAADVRICSFMSGSLKNCVFVVYAAAIVLAVISVYLFPVMASFDGRLRTLIKYSVCFAGSNLFYAAIVVVLAILPMLLTYMNMDYLPLSAFLWCFFGFAAMALLQSVFFLRLFRKFLSPTAAEQEQAKEQKILQEIKKMEG